MWLVLCLFGLSPGLAAQQVVVDTLMFNGPAANRINFVVLGDGFTAGQMPAFRAQAEKATAHLFNTSPFREYRRYFNVFALRTPSREPGAAGAPERPIDNYFGSTFGYGGIDRLLVPAQNHRITEVLAAYLPDCDQALMLVNSDRYGGSGGDVATASLHPAAVEILTHELGHSFADLADEYWAGPGYAAEKPNMTRQGSPQHVKWKNWLNDLGVGIYPHSGDRAWYRPHQVCKMQTLQEPFCPVCREAIVQKIQYLTFPLDGYAPDAVQLPADTVFFRVTPVTPEPNTLRLTWLVDDRPVAVDRAAVGVPYAALAGAGKVRCVVYDSTSFDRRTTLLLHAVTWEVAGHPAGTEKVLSGRDDLVRLSQSRERPLKLTFFPNPFTDRVQVGYSLFEATPVELELYGAGGQLIRQTYLARQQPGAYEHTFELRDQAAGPYVLLVRTNAYTYRAKLVKIE
ncbi:MAG: hypothetical protein ICV83_33025, partial [Cytophagales bacterium]|nr:hypothetical protein [Cytophagales bacterium]